MNLIGKWLDRAEKVCLAGSAFTAAAIMLLTVIDVVLRKFSHHSIPSLYEFAQDYLMVALVFLSISPRVQDRGPRAGGALYGLYSRGPPGPRSTNCWKSSLLGFFLLLSWAGWSAAAEAWSFNEVSSSMLAYPLAPALFLVPLGCGLSACRVVQNIFRPPSPA